MVWFYLLVVKNYWTICEKQLFQKQVNSLNVTLFTLNDTNECQITKTTTKNFKNRLLNERNCSPNPLIFEITSLWIKQIVISELSYLHNLTLFWHRICSNLVCLSRTTIKQMGKTKNMADVEYQRVTKTSGFIPHPFLKNHQKFFITDFFMLTFKFAGFC